MLIPELFIDNGTVSCQCFALLSESEKKMFTKIRMASRPKILFRPTKKINIRNR